MTAPATPSTAKGRAQRVAPLERLAHFTPTREQKTLAGTPRADSQVRLDLLPRVTGSRISFERFQPHFNLRLKLGRNLGGLWNSRDAFPNQLAAPNTLLQVEVKYFGNADLLHGQ